MSDEKDFIYIAGPMRGYENYNYPAFDTAQKYLESRGAKVINPANLDRLHGKPPANAKDFNPFECYEHQEFLREALGRDMEAICKRCKGLYMLRNWKDSLGATAEHALGVALGLDIHYEKWSNRVDTD